MFGVAAHEHARSGTLMGRFDRHQFDGKEKREAGEAKNLLW
jgi:hypothetical protein